ncbi:MAG: hypothetical protein WDO19_24775 [Bacteroidota bacterium]
MQSIYVTGNFQNTCVFNGTSLVANGGNDFFLARINDETNVIILPLRLLSFTGKRVNNLANRLQWQTADEVNTRQFIIEKSSTGGQLLSYWKYRGRASR